ncbi:MAG: tRNA uridine(34) 5-carboxymethylaminomethyl modification radical SAM/GNAT enzyme Elp3 [Nitrososphaerota archaeon]
MPRGNDENTDPIRANKYLEEFIENLKTNNDLGRLKLELAKVLKIKTIPSNIQLISELRKRGIDDHLVSKLRKKPVKTRAGVTVITVVAPLFNCPHGRCIYCPGGGSTGIPRSYSGKELQIMSARELDYDAEKQVQRCIERLTAMGHSVDKVELIIIGGTFTASPIEFQREIIKSALDGLHGQSSSSLEEAIHRAEKTRPYVSGITIETRPDWVSEKEADALLSMGVTRVELGVQALDDEIYKILNRGHTVDDVARATRILRDRAFKICYHLMPGLPGSSPEKDIEMYRQVFSDPRFRPDMVKIYPLMVLPDTPLYDLWKRREYTSYPLEVLTEVLVKWLELTPPYVRIQRIRREIPASEAVDGKYPGNLRELVEQELERRGMKCKCIRCREVGNPKLAKRLREVMNKMRILETWYETDGGQEVFISYETPDRVVLSALLRLRLPYRSATQLTENSALVRELHVYGRMVPVGHLGEERDAWQHRGIGSMLLRRAEEIAIENGYRRIIVISGIGVKQYYTRHGYHPHGPYMAKNL